MQDAVLANMAMRRDGNPRFQARARTNHSTLFHHAQGPDLNAGMHLGAGVDHGTGVDQGTGLGLSCHRLGFPQLGGSRPIGIRIGRQNASAALHCFMRLGRRKNHTRCLAAGQLAEVLRVA